MVDKTKLLSNKKIEIDGEKFRIPWCPVCGAEMIPAYDTIAKKVTGYWWYCKFHNYFTILIG